MSWIPATETERKAMLDTIGVSDIDDLFETVPKSLRMKTWDVPPGLSDRPVRRHIADLAAADDRDMVCFLGGGYYDHFIPAAVDALSGRSEFYTAYTPYQPECSQGTLQAIYEYQSAVCRLTGMEFANASLYDGGTATFEACTLAARVTRRSKVVLHGSLNPRWREMLETHALNLDIDIVDGDDPTDAACVIVQNPTFLGTIRDYTDLAQRCHDAGAQLVVAFNPVSLGLLKTPGEMGADIAIGEGQGLGMPLGFGGPYLGMMATKKNNVRKMPGRIAGRTVDTNGKQGFVLTLQAREQHIRRNKAMSNICSNQALCALRALIHLCLLGKEGLREVATACHAKSEYLKSQLKDHAELLNDGPTFNEFALRLSASARDTAAALRDRGFLAGLPLEDVNAGGPNDLLIAVTEQRTREELDAFATALKEVACP